MLREDTIKIEGGVVAVLPRGLCRVELSNGHRLLAHLSVRLRSGQTELAPGDRVTVEMSPFDMSRGRIILKEQ